MRWLPLMLVVGCGSTRPNGIDPPPLDTNPPVDTRTDGSTDPDGSTTTPDTSTTSDASVIPDAATPDAPASLCPPNTWCVEPSPVAATLLNSVWAVNANDVFAVGDAGTILRRRNNTWSQETSGTTSNLRGVWAASSTDIWVVGEGGTVLRGNGTTWSPVGTFTSDFKSIWGSGPNDVWFSAFGKVVNWNGAVFTTKNLAGIIFGVHGTGSTDVWATGENAKVDHFTGAWTTGIDAGGGNSYFGIHALATNNVFVAGIVPGAETRQFNGTTWTPRAATGCVFLGFFSTSATNLWGVGGTKVGRWDGASWTVEAPAGAVADLRSVSGAGSDVWVVGSESLILHRN